MPTIIVNRPFAYAHGGHTVEEFAVTGEPREVPDDCAALAIREGWAHAAPAAPENKDAAPQRRGKKTAASG